MTSPASSIRSTYMPSDDFLPTASLDMLQLRSDMLHWLRTFFRERGYWEVQTPLLSRDVGVDVWLEPFAVLLTPDGASPECGYLQTSPEFAMKRLLAAGAKAIFQVTQAFRQGEAGPRHNPEFTMAEWYRAGDSYHDQMSLTEQLTAGFLEAARQRAEDQRLDCSTVASRQGGVAMPFLRLTYDAAFKEACGRSVLAASMAQIRDLTANLTVTPPASLAADDRDGWLNLLLAEVVEPRLGEHTAMFLYDYPASQAALARIRPDDPPVAERFELYLSGMEICNGYQELTDPDELRQRIAVHSHRRAEAGLPSLPRESRLLAAMEAGLPGCSGVALGFDRLLMTALGCASITEVMPFPFDRA